RRNGGRAAGSVRTDRYRTAASVPPTSCKHLSNDGLTESGSAPPRRPLLVLNLTRGNSIVCVCVCVCVCVRRRIRPHYGKPDRPGCPLRVISRHMVPRSTQPAEPMAGASRIPFQKASLTTERQRGPTALVGDRHRVCLSSSVFGASSRQPPPAWVGIRFGARHPCLPCQAVVGFHQAGKLVAQARGQPLALSGIF